MSSARSEPARSVGETRRALMTVDDSGEYVVCVGESVLLGHRRGGHADLPVLADVGVKHARFIRRTSLASGADWWLEPLAGERTLRNAEPLSAPSPLADGDVLRLGGNLDLRVCMPDPASATVVLDFLRGVDCMGAEHAILLVPGVGGRLRIGAAARRQIRVPNLLVGVDLVLEDDQIRVSSEAGVVLAGARSDSQVLTFPPAARVDLALGFGEGGRPPFCLSLSPLPPARSG